MFVNRLLVSSPTTTSSKNKGANKQLHPSRTHNDDGSGSDVDNEGDHGVKDVGVITDEQQGQPDCNRAPIQVFIEEIWKPSREALEGCRERDLFTVLKPIEVHMRQNLMLSYFFPRRAMMIDEEERERGLLEDLEAVRREGIEAMVEHVLKIAAPTMQRIEQMNDEANEIATKIEAAYEKDFC